MARSGWQPLYLNGIPRRGFSPLFVLFGILVGLLLGVGFKFEYESDVEAGLHEGSWVSESSGSASGSHEIWLRCVIMVQPFTPKAEKFVSASQETFGKKCNETLYFTSSSELMKKFSGTKSQSLLGCFASHGLYFRKREHISGGYES